MISNVARRDANRSRDIFANGCPTSNAARCTANVASLTSALWRTTSANSHATPANDESTSATSRTTAAHHEATANAAHAIAHEHGATSAISCVTANRTGLPANDGDFISAVFHEIAAADRGINACAPQYTAARPNHSISAPRPREKFLFTFHEV
jgi:hypothetical protein